MFRAADHVVALYELRAQRAYTSRVQRLLELGFQAAAADRERMALCAAVSYVKANGSGWDRSRDRDRAVEKEDVDDLACGVTGLCRILRSCARALGLGGRARRFLPAAERRGGRQAPRSDEKGPTNACLERALPPSMPTASTRQPPRLQPPGSAADMRSAI